MRFLPKVYMFFFWWFLLDGKPDRLQDIQDTKSQVLKSSTLEAQYSVSAANGDSATVLGVLMLA